MKSTAIVDGIVGQLEREIVFGQLRPYEPLVEDLLMEQFGAKRHVVRQAIQHLVDRGIAVKEAGKSARVRFYSAEEVEQIYQVRVGLFRLAVEIMPLPVDPAVIEQLRLHQREHAKAVEEQDFLEIYAANDRYHEVMLGSCRNPYLMDTIRDYERLSTHIRSFGISDESVMRNSIREHSEMIDAIVDQDRERLKSLVAQHVELGKTVYLRSLGARDRLVRPKETVP